MTSIDARRGSRRTLHRRRSARWAVVVLGWATVAAPSAPAVPAVPAAPSSAAAASAAPYAARLDVAALAALGRTLFHDPALSANGRVACASCHDPAHAHGPPNALVVQPSGSREDDRSGLRTTPSLRYLQSVPPYTEHFRDNEGDDSVDKGPTGGYMWDGRAESVRDQARLPLLSRSEMANPDIASVAAKLKRAAYAPALRGAFGADLFERGDAAVFDAAALALEVFQQSPTEFYPYTSRYDAVLRGQAALDPREAHGLALFNDPAKGNCAACHPSAPTPDGAFPLFTDFGHIALGVPRNPAIHANADPRFFDLGLCGPLRSDLADRAEDCGRFRTPSLRNVAVRRRFFHNGRFAALEDAIRFYASRDTDPGHWYPAGRRFDDLPPAARANVDSGPPFGRPAGTATALTEAEIAAIAAFLRTLTDRDAEPAAVRPGAVDASRSP